MLPVHIGSTPMCSPRQTCYLCTLADRPCVVPGRLELPTSTLSVWRSNQLSYRTGIASGRADWNVWGSKEHKQKEFLSISIMQKTTIGLTKNTSKPKLFQKGGVPAAPSGTATLLRLSPNHLFHPRPILIYKGHGLQAPQAFMA